MSDRRCAAIVPVALILLVASGCARPVEDGRAGLLPGIDRPNVVLIVTDDQRFDAMFAMPRAEKLLTERGVTFEQAFASNPVCCPFRTSLLAGGVYSHDTGVLTALPPNGGAQLFDDRVTLGTLLQRRGYRTALIGKYLNAYRALAPRVPPGWTRFVAGTRPGIWRDSPFVAGSSGPDGPATGETITAEGYITRFEVNQALDFLDRAAPAGPFFLYLAHHAPHRPATAPRADRRQWRDYRYRARAWGEEDLADKPSWVQERAPGFARWAVAGEGMRVHPRPPVPADLPRRQLASLQPIDRGVALLDERLEALGVAGRTVVILTSDNGFLWGEHRLFAKAMPYEESVRVPLVVRVPGVAPGRRSELALADLDVAATILALAGVERPADGRSLLPLVADPSARWRDEVLLEGFGVYRAVPAWAVLRGPRWKYVEYASGERELYDLENDPYELESLHDDPAQARRLAAAARRLAPLRGLAIASPFVLPPATVGEPYRYQLTGWGGTPPYHWRLVPGARPAWLTLSPDGILTGTPQERRATNFAVELTDASEPLASGRLRFYQRRFGIEVR